LASAFTVTFPIKKVEAQQLPDCVGRFCEASSWCSSECYCLIKSPGDGVCINILYKDAVMTFGENLICQDDTECKNKGTGNFCVRSSNLDVEYGVCADSISEAKDLIFNIVSSKSKSTKDFLKMPTMAA
jgi:hypothetical protein